MKIFIDANILVAVLNKEYPLFSYAARVLSLPSSKYQLYTSAVCLSIAYYFAEKKSGYKKAKEKMSLLLEHISVANCGEKESVQAIKNTKVKDYEDGIEYYAAMNEGCKCIVTENLGDFYFSEIEVLNAKLFLEKYYFGL